MSWRMLLGWRWESRRAVHFKCKSSARSGGTRSLFRAKAFVQLMVLMFDLETPLSPTRVKEETGTGETLLRLTYYSQWLLNWIQNFPSQKIAKFNWQIKYFFVHSDFAPRSAYFFLSTRDDMLHFLEVFQFWRDFRLLHGVLIFWHHFGPISGYLDTIFRLGWHSLAGSGRNPSACLDSGKQSF